MIIVTKTEFTATFSFPGTLFIVIVVVGKVVDEKISDKKRKYYKRQSETILGLMSHEWIIQ